MKNKTSVIKFLFISLIVSNLLQSCLKQDMVLDVQKSESEINKTLDDWHEAAAKAQFADYFDLMTDNAVFMGTDATERWKKTEFQTYAKPYFDQGKAWTFKSLERNIEIDSLHQIAWFDELLETSFKICRGSGVMIKQDKQWKIQYYVLSMTIPNEQSRTVVQLKDSIETRIIQKLFQKK